MVSRDARVSLDDLQILRAVEEAGGFSAAARRLGLSKTLVSTAIARLEEALAVQLVQRTTRRCTLTEAGAAALPHVRAAVDAAEDAVTAATLQRDRPRGTLRVNAPMTFGITHIAPAITAFMRQAPELHVDLQLDDRVVDIVDGRFDIAVRIGTALPDSGLVATRLAETRQIVVAAPVFAAGLGAQREPADLASLPALAYTLSTNEGWRFMRDGRIVDILPNPVFRANSSLAIKHAALDGLGMARVPEFAVAGELAAGRLVQLLPDWAMPALGIHALTTARATQPLKTRLFIRFLKQKLAQDQRRG